MKQILVIALALGFFYINVLESEADDFDKYEEQLSRKEMTCYNPRDYRNWKFATDGTSLWSDLGQQSSLGLIRKGNSFPDPNVYITSFTKKSDEEIWIFTWYWVLPGYPWEEYVNFEQRVFISDGNSKAQCW